MIGSTVRHDEMDVKLSSADSPWSRYRKKRLSENAAAVAAAELRADGAIKPRVLARNSQAPAAAAGAGARQRKTEVGWSAPLISHKALDGARRPAPAASPRLRSADDLDPKGRLGVHGSMTS